MDGIEARLRRLEDVEAIRRLQLVYRERLDAGDYAGFAALFTEDGEWQGASGRERGPAAIQAMLERGQIPGVGSEFHLAANQVIEVDGDQAEARSTFVMLDRAEDGGPSVRMLGTYLDHLVRTDAGWRFRRRVARVDVPTRPLFG